MLGKVGSMFAVDSSALTEVEKEWLGRVQVARREGGRADRGLRGGSGELPESPPQIKERIISRGKTQVAERSSVSPTGFLHLRL